MTNTNTIKCLSALTACSVFGLFALPLAATPFPTTTFTAQDIGGSAMFTGGNFEEDDITSFEYLHDAVWNGWTFSPWGSGITKEGYAFAENFADIPGLEYALFLQGDISWVEVSPSKTAGIYQIRFEGVQRDTDEEQQIRVKVDGVTVFDEVLADDSIREYSSRPFRHSGGTMTVRIEGHTYGPNSAIIDRVWADTVGDWTSNSTWEESGAPDDWADVVEIPEGVSVAIPEDEEALAGYILVKGHLGVLEEATSLETRMILIDGSEARFQVGTENVRHEEDFEILLKGNNTAQNIEDFGTKFIGAQMGGVLDLHGREATSWGLLDVTVSEDNDTIRVRNVSGWRVGDEIVITPTKSGIVSPTPASFGWDEAEVRTIDSINVISSEVTEFVLDSDLDYDHLGVTRTFTRPGEDPWDVETRAYVGLLTRNLKVEGYIGTEPDFGGHIMIMGAHDGMGGYGIGRLSGVQLFSMGQKRMLGRYPFHWHMLGEDGEGQFIRDCSVHESYNRAITIHGTHKVEVDRNVAYDHLGHGIFLEDGSEEDNFIRENLVLGTIQPDPGDEVIPSDNSHNEDQNRSPSSFWITNPKNTIDDNIAAGTEGSGYWFALPENPTGPSAGDDRFDTIKPRENSIVSFADNKSFSSALGIDINDSIDPVTFAIIKNVPWTPGELQILEGFTTVGNNTAIYTGMGSEDGEIEFLNARLLDNKWQTMLASYQTLRESLFVDYTDELLDGGSTVTTAVVLYDGPGRFIDNHYDGYDQGTSTLVRNFGGAGNRSNWIFSGNTYDHVGLPNMAFSPVSTSGLVAHEMDVIMDLDGSLTGVSGGARVTTAHGSLRSTTDEYVQPTNWSEAHITSLEYISTNFIFKDEYDVNITASEMTMSLGKEGMGLLTEGSTNEEYAHGNRCFVIAANSDFSGSGYHWTQVDFPTGLVADGGVNLHYRDSEAGDEALLRFIDMDLIGAVVGNATEEMTYGDLLDATSTSYYVETATDDIWLKIVSTATSRHQQKVITFTW
ncbi:MAG: G8 domain-containing protein [Verrucomicrobiales bacterium]|nr:G8 domain-containing protein [Verrucomicrobiales bacterium]